MRHLEISQCEIDSAFIDGLSRFSRLPYLSLVSYHQHEENIPDDVWTQLQQFKALIDVKLTIKCTQIGEKFYKYLTGAQSSLQQIGMDPYGSIPSDNCIATLAQFKCLKKLHFQICNIEGGDEINWQPFKDLNQLNELVLMFVWGRTIGKITRNFLKNLGSKNTLKKLQIWAWKFC